MAPHARTITVALDMSKAFDTINIHSLIRKLLQTNIPGRIIKFIASYIKGRKPTQHIETRHCQFKTGVPQGGVLSSTLQNYHHPAHRFRSWPTQTTSPSHLHTQADKKYIQPYLHKVLHGQINNNALPMATHPKVLGHTLDAKLTYIHNITVQAHMPLQMIRALTATGDTHVYL